MVLVKPINKKSDYKLINEGSKNIVNDNRNNIK